MSSFVAWPRPSATASNTLCPGRNAGSCETIASFNCCRAPRLAVVPRGKPLDDFQETGFPGAVAPDQSDALAGLDHEIDAIEQRHMAVKPATAVIAGGGAIDGRRGAGASGRGALRRLAHLDRGVAREQAPSARDDRHVDHLAGRSANGRAPLGSGLSRSRRSRASRGATSFGGGRVLLVHDGHCPGWMQLAPRKPKLARILRTMRRNTSQSP